MTFETDYQRLFETKLNQAGNALQNSIDVEIILTCTPYIFFEHFKLDCNYRAYLEDVMSSNRVPRMRIKTTLYQKRLQVANLEL